MKTGFIYRNPIFISEVKKRLADKRNYKLKTKLIMIDKLPMRNTESQKNSLIISQNESQTNYKYFINFIKEKGYKSAFRKLSNSMKNFLTYKNKSFSNNSNKINTNLIKGVPNIIKLYNKQKDNSCQINIQKYKLINQNKTPFQINHIKNKFLKQYIKFTTKKNSLHYIPNEEDIKSYSINSCGQRIKIFGKAHTLLRNLSNTNDLLSLHKTSKTLNKLSSDKRMRKKYLCKSGKDSGGRKYCSILKPNCYYNRINLIKYCSKTKQ